MKVSELQIQARIQPLKPGKVNPAPAQKGTDVRQKEAPSFGEVLRKTVDQNETIRFSSHALRRLEERNLTLTDSQLHRLNEGVRQLNARGSQNSVILLDNTAYVVSVRNKTVVTAVNNAAENNNIFTNIDSMAIV